MNEATASAPRPVRPRNTAEHIGLGAIRRVVQDFYARVRRDPLLGPRFAAVVEDWPAHEAKLTHFWWVSLGGPAYAPYRYRVVDAHARIAVRGEEIRHWLALFEDCLHAHLPADLAAPWLARAQAMGRSLSLIAQRAPC